MEQVKMEFGGGLKIALATLTLLLGLTLSSCSGCNKNEPPTEPSENKISDTDAGNRGGDTPAPPPVPNDGKDTPKLTPAPNNKDKSKPPKPNDTKTPKQHERVKVTKAALEAVTNAASALQGCIDSYVFNDAVDGLKKDDMQDIVDRARAFAHEAEGYLQEAERANVDTWLLSSNEAVEDVKVMINGNKDKDGLVNDEKKADDRVIGIEGSLGRKEIADTDIAISKAALEVWNARSFLCRSLIGMLLSRLGKIIEEE
jgi:type IV secretory pathway VirB10-like protein